jgi:hypothetical protein
MIIIRATLGDAELNLGIVEDDFDVEAWLESKPLPAGPEPH